MSLLHTTILSDLTKKVGDVVNGFLITKLDRATGVCELERYQAPVDLSPYAKKLDIPSIENKNLYSGTGAPTADIGADGDFYEDLTAKAGEFSIYGPKAGGVWPAAAYRKIDDLSVLATKTALTAEETARKSADDALDAKITAEKTARESADTALDLRMVTAENLLNKRQAIRLNRSPTNLDAYEDGTIWEDISFGETTPLRYVSVSAGVWAFQSQISLTKIRLFCNGNKATYRSSISNVKVFKADGSQVPNNHFVWGASSGISGGSAGVAYTGQQIYCGYNSYGWVDIEVSGLFDTSISIGKLTADYPSDSSFVQCSRVEFWYSNGSRKPFNGTGYQANGGQTLCNVDPAVVCRYGDALAAAQGEMLTAAKLSDPDDHTYGRTSGAANVSAFNQLLAKAKISNLIPTIQAGLTDTQINLNAETPFNLHLNSSLSPINWDVANAKDGAWFWVMNTGNESATIGISNAEGIYVRSGTANELQNNSLDIPAGASGFVHVTDNQGHKFVNLALIQAGGGTVDLSAVNAAIAALVARKEVKASFTTTTLVDGSTLPVTPDFPGPSASGMTHDGDGAVAGATSWNCNGPIAVDISQSGLPDDEYEISIGFGAANPTARCGFRIGTIFQYYDASGVGAGPLDMVEFQTGNWRGVTLKGKGDFTGRALFNTKNSTFIGPVIKRKRASGYAVDGKGLALLSDIPASAAPPDLTLYALNTTLGAETVNRTAADAALTKRLDDLWLSYATQSWVNDQLADVQGMVNNIPDMMAAYAKTADLTAETTARTEADTALDARLDTLEAKPDPTQGQAIDFKTDAANNQVAQLWTAYALSSALNPKQFADVNALLNFNTTGLQPYRTGYIKSTKESVYWDKDATEGDYKPNTGPGYWLKAGGSITQAERSAYHGTFSDQAGNTGHQFTQQRKTGAGITTSDNITFTLSGGVYRVEFGILRHQAYGTWRNTGMAVDGTNVETIYSGHDGSNWPGGSSMVRYVDATTTNKTVKITRLGSTNNGNASGYLDIRQESQIAIPDGSLLLTPRNITGSITSQGYDNVELPYQIPLAAGQILDTVSLNGTATTNFDANTGIVRIKPNGGNVAVTHTTRAGATFSGLQLAGQYGGALNINTTAQNVKLSVVLQDGDLLETMGDYNGDVAQSQSFWHEVTPGRMIRQAPWPASDHIISYTFPNPLTDTISVAHGGGNGSFRIRRIRVWRDALNGYVVPTGYATRANCTLTAGSGTFAGGATTATIPTDTGQYIGFTVPNGQILQSVASNNPSVTVGAADPRAGTVFVTVANGATGAALTPTFVASSTARMLVQVNSGVSATLGTLRFQVAPSGNRSLMVASATGSNCVLRIQNLWEGGGDGNGLNNVTALPGSFVYARAGGWNFTNQGNHQYCFIEDVTNNRFYHVMMEIGAAYNNNTLSGWEVV